MGLFDGLLEGFRVGLLLGKKVGASTGEVLGESVGASIGENVGESVGASVSIFMMKERRGCGVVHKKKQRMKRAKNVRTHSEALYVAHRGIMMYLP